MCEREYSQFIEWEEISCAVNVLASGFDISACNKINSDEAAIQLQAKQASGLVSHEQGSSSWCYTKNTKKGINKLSKLWKLTKLSSDRSHTLVGIEGVPEYDYNFRDETHTNKILNEFEDSGILGGDEGVETEYVRYCIELARISYNNEFDIDSALQGQGTRMMYILSEETGEIASFVIYTTKTTKKSQRNIRKNKYTRDLYPVSTDGLSICVESYINVVCTHPEYQGLGLARNLINRVNQQTRNMARYRDPETTEDACCAAGIAKMSLHPIDENVKGLYKHIGFVNTGPNKLMTTIDLM